MDQKNNQDDPVLILLRRIKSQLDQITEEISELLPVETIKETDGRR